MEKFKYQILKEEIKTQGQIVSIDEVTKLDHHRVTGVFYTISNDNLIPGTEVRLSIDGEEILPENFELGILTKQMNQSLSYKEITHEFDEKAKGSKIKGEFRDGGKVPTTPSPDPIEGYPYTIRMYLITTKKTD